MSSVQERVSNMKTSDKVIGAILLLVVGSGVLYGLSIVMPILVALAANTIYFIGELAVLAVLAMVLLDKDTWTNVFYGWKSVSRAIRRMIINSDPIAVLNTVIQRLTNKLEEIRNSIVDVGAAIKRQQDAQHKMIRSRDEELGLARAAKAADKPELAVGQHARAAQRWEESAKSLQPQIDNFTKAMHVMEKAEELCASNLDDYKNQLNVMKVTNDAAVAGQKAIRKIRRFLVGNPELDMQEMAVDEIERRASQTLSEIDQFQRYMAPSLEREDLKNSADMQTAMMHFDKYLSGQSTSTPALTSGEPEATIVQAIPTQNEKKESARR